MGCSEGSYESASRKPLHLRVPNDDPFPLGLKPFNLRIRADLDLDAVVLTARSADETLEFMLGVPAAIELTLRLVASVDRLQTHARRRING
jgi:hypothetical protein